MSEVDRFFTQATIFLVGGLVVCALAPAKPGPFLVFGLLILLSIVYAVKGFLDQEIERLKRKRQARDE